MNKPKPKVELPKEEQKPTEPNGPLDGQGDGSGTQPPEQGSAPTATEKKLPEMDIDWISALVYIIANYNKALSCQLCTFWIQTEASESHSTLGNSWRGLGRAAGQNMEVAKDSLSSAVFAFIDCI